MKIYLKSSQWRIPQLWKDRLDKKLHVSDFRNYVLRGVNLKGRNFLYITFQDADLRDTHFEDAVLCYVNFQDTIVGDSNFEGAKLLHASLHGANFQHTIFDEKTEITLEFSGDIYFDFGLRGSILTAINSINNKYKNLKINLMKQIFEYLQDKDITPILGSLKYILFYKNNGFDYITALSMVQEFGKNLSLIQQFGVKR